MKRTQIFTKCVAALAVAATILVPTANAITLSYETAGPWGPAGTAFGVGPVEFVFSGVGAGTVYNPGGDAFGPVGTVVGSGSPAIGVGLMNALPGQFNQPKAIGSEDQFGVLFVQQIKDANTNAVIWSPAGKNAQLTGTFFGGTDIWGRQDAIGANSTDTTVQTGFKINLYEQTPQAPNPNLSTITPADRGTGLHLEGVTPNAADFPLWTEDQNGAAAPNLTLALTLKGVTGFLDPSNGATPLLNQNTEVQSTFVSSVGGQGIVQGFLEVTNPALGSNAMFDNNQFAAIHNNNRADARFTFTQQTLPGTNPWTVNVNGPAQTLVIPEPSSILTGIACMWPVFGSFLSRRKKHGRV